MQGNVTLGSLGFLVKSFRSGPSRRHSRGFSLSLFAHIWSQYPCWHKAPTHNLSLVGYAPTRWGLTTRSRGKPPQWAQASTFDYAFLRPLRRFPLNSGVGRLSFRFKKYFCRRRVHAFPAAAGQLQDSAFPSLVLGNSLLSGSGIFIRFLRPGFSGRTGKFQASFPVPVLVMRRPGRAARLIALGGFLG